MRGPKAAGAAAHRRRLHVDVADPGRHLRRGRRAPARHTRRIGPTARRLRAARCERDGAEQRAADRTPCRRSGFQVDGRPGLPSGTCPPTGPAPSGWSPRWPTGYGRRRDVHLGPRRRPTSSRSPQAAGRWERRCSAGRPHGCRHASWRWGRSPRPDWCRSGLGVPRRAPQRPARCHGAGAGGRPRRNGRSCSTSPGCHCPDPGTDWWSVGDDVADQPHRPRAGRARDARRPTGSGGVEAGHAAARCGPASRDEHVVEVTVGRLRRRLGPAGTHIETVMRRGYRLSTT